MVLGLDGMDYGLVKDMIGRGKLPTLARLAATGGFSPLTTSIPPQSPTAWSNFITGLDAGHHAIFDFIERNPDTLEPYLSTSEVAPPKRLCLGSLAVPLGGGEPKLLRQEKPFWWHLSQAGIPATVIKIPAHFPPRDDGHARVITDMGTPDLLGTYGTFTVLTSDKALSEKHLSGGRAVLLRKDPRTGRFTGRLEGPPHPLSCKDSPLSLDVEVAPDMAGRGALVTLGGNEVLLGVGEWSGWVEVDLEVVPMVSKARAIARLYLKALTPGVILYISPLNIDPLDPILPISSPPEYAAELAAKAGRFYTQGMPEDTKALSGGVLDEREFLAQAGLVLEERRRMLTAALADFRSGFLFFYFGSSDQIAHMFFRARDARHPARSSKDDPYATVIEDVYTKLDAEVKRTWDALSPGDLLLVISDHGFGSASYLFDLNGWLQQQGYLTQRETAPEKGFLGHIDWEKTQAYGLGLNGLYLNLKGRERHGAVPKERADELMTKLAEELLSVTHPETGQQVVTQVTRTAEVYPGPALDRAPDLIVGYGAGYKVQDSSALGSVGSELFSMNKGAWNGDHCGDNRLVPGILFSNRKLTSAEHSLLDLAPTVLGEFGVKVPVNWKGHPVVTLGGGQKR